MNIQELEAEVKRLDAVIRTLEENMDELRNRLEKRNLTVSKLAVHQSNHIDRLYDLAYELATPNNTKDLMHHASLLKGVHHREVEEIFPQNT